MSVLSNEKYSFVNKLVQSVIEDLHLDDYHFEIDNSSATANGYMSLIFFVEVRHKNGTLHLAVKASTQDEEQRKFADFSQVFALEIHIYKNVFQAFDEFQKERSIQRPFNGVAKYFLGCSKEGSEGLVLENLRATGFCLANRQEPLDENQVVLVLREYGRFHAISYAMKDQKPKKFRQLTENMIDCFKIFLERPGSIENYQARFGILSDVLRKQNCKNVAERIDRFISRIPDFMINCAKPDDHHSVILHGDCWTNNIMFKYRVTIAI